MQRRDHPVEPAELLVGQVERPVDADVDLDAAQDAERRELLVQRRDLLALLLQAAVAQALGVVADRQVVVAAAHRGSHHLGERRAAVRPGRVAVQLAAQRAVRDELGQPVAAPGVEPRRVQLACALAQLGRDPRVAEERVDALLVGVPGDLAGRLDLDAVLRDREAAPLRVLAQLDVVLLRPGEVLEQVAVGLRLDDAEVELQPLARDHRRLRVALRHDLEHPWQRREVVDQRDGIGCGRDQVDVAERLAAPAQRARLRDLHGGRVRAQLLDDRESRRQPVAQQGAPLLHRALLAQGVECLHDRRLQLRPHARERPQLLALGGGAQLRDGRHAELLPDLARRLRSEARELREEDDVGRDDRPELRQRRDLAGLDDLDDLLLDRLADPGQLLRAAVERELGDRGGRLADAERCTPVRRDAERLLALDLEHVAEQVELRRDVLVAGKRARSHGGDDTSAPPAGGAARPVAQAPRRRVESFS